MTLTPYYVFFHVVFNLKNLQNAIEQHIYYSL